MRTLRVPFYRQQTAFWCGPAVLQMLAAFFGLRRTRAYFVRHGRITKKYGMSHAELERLARAEGFVVRSRVRARIADIRKSLERGSPVVVNYIEPRDNEGHYAIVVGATKHALILNDPFLGRGFRIGIREFRKRWKAESPREVRSPRWMAAVKRGT